MTALRDVAGVVRGSVVREADFATLGFLHHRWGDRLTFVESERALTRVDATRGIAAVLTTSELAWAIPAPVGILVTADPRQAFFALHEHLAAATSFYGALPNATIARTARVHERAWIAPHGVVIAEGVVVEPHATVLAGTRIGEASVIRAGVVVGGEGFQVTIGQSGVRRLTHAGGVEIGAGVEIQSNCCVDRALFGGVTGIGDESTLDKLVYVAHHVSLGRQCRVGAGAAITGSVTVGDGVWIGPNATISDGVTIGAGAMVSLGSVVTRDVPAGQRVTGNFAVPHDRFLDALRRTR
jgi:UDP-3-O-[3-hydroxymyristoyl] glucosamine N-acyltransferase